MSEEQGGALGMWADMLGLGEMVRTVQSGDFQARLQAFANAVAATEARTQRIDAWCQAIVTRLNAIESKLDGYAAMQSAPAVSVRDGDDGPGMFASPGFVADDGVSIPAPPDRGNGEAMVDHGTSYDGPG